MNGERTDHADVVIRRASADDYDAFRGLFPELTVDDPVPAVDVWTSVLAPSTWIAAQREEVVGYCYFQEYAESGYVRAVVVAPAARQRGVGRALMSATAAYLRSRGKTSWRLNVKPTNRAALSLYRSLGLRPKYLTKALRLPWAALEALPAGDAVVETLTPARDASVERAFGLARGQLNSARDAKRLLLEATSRAGRTAMGLAVFEPEFPGAFPFRIRELDALTPLLRVMRQHAPTDDHVQLVVEDDERLAVLLFSVGAILKFDICHMEGPL